MGMCCAGTQIGDLKLGAVHCRDTPARSTLVRSSPFALAPCECCAQSIVYYPRARCRVSGMRRSGEMCLMRDDIQSAAMANVIRFGSPREDYGFFSNFAPTPIVLRGKTW